LAQLVKEFSIEKVQKAGAVFNIQRLDFLDGLYIREKSIEKLTELCVPYLKKAGLLVEGHFTQNKLQEIVEVSRTRMKKLSEIVELADFFFPETLTIDLEMLKWQQMTKEDIKDSLLFSEKTLSESKKWELSQLETEMFSASEKFNLQKSYPEKNKGYLLWPLRVALSGKKMSPSPFEIVYILGKEETLKRLNRAIKLLS
jgi:glutamyl/glutaminyl-tRNA synthetase